jgi:hypothetical protein
MTAVRTIFAADGRVELLLGSESEQHRRRLGMTAWLTLQSLVFDATLLDDRLVVATSARHVAARLGIGKDRGAAALTVLRDAGLLTRLATRDAPSARFVAARYTINLPVSSRADVASRAPASTTVASARRSERGALDRLFEFET